MFGLLNKEFIKSLIVALAIALSINTFIFNITYVKGDSMNPSLKNKDRLIVKKYGVVLNIEKYKRGDIVVFTSPAKGDSRLFIKRVIGLPGDKINIMEGRLYIDDKLIEETYIDEGAFTESLIYGDDYLVSSDELFVVGDNRKPRASNDSRLFSGVTFKDIKGKVVYRIFPFKRIGKEL